MARLKRPAVLPAAKPGHYVDKYGRQLRLPYGPPYVESNGICARCLASSFVIVPNDDPKSVGLGAHVMLCSELCEKRPWTCVKCAAIAEGEKGPPQHMKWCEVAHAGYRAKWEESRAGFGGQMLRLATMIAMRGETLPPFLMDMLFDRDDPQGLRKYGEFR